MEVLSKQSYLPDIPLLDYYKLQIHPSKRGFAGVTSENAYAIHGITSR